jgi:ferredoxin
MGIVETAAHPDTTISHGICRNCLDNMTFQAGVTMQTYIDSMSVPIMVIDVRRGRAIVKAVNKRASLALRKQPEEMVQHLAGNVFECAYARHPEGCGGTIHCSACTIRRSVLRTFETGEPQSMVPAMLRLEQGEMPCQIAMYITTVKADDMVMLRIDNAAAPGL